MARDASRTRKGGLIAPRQGSEGRAYPSLGSGTAIEPWENNTGEKSDELSRLSPGELLTVRFITKQPDRVQPAGKRLLRGSNLHAFRKDGRLGGNLRQTRVVGGDDGTGQRRHGGTVIRRRRAEFGTRGSRQLGRSAEGGRRGVGRRVDTGAGFRQAARLVVVPETAGLGRVVQGAAIRCRGAGAQRENRGQ